MKLFKKPEEVAGSATPAILMGGFASLGGILFGYDTGTISGILAMDYWVRLFSTHVNVQGQAYITTGEQSLIVSILSAGTFFGALSGAPIGDLAGRRLGLLVSCVIFNIGVVMQTAATAIPLFTAGRAVAGFGVGLLSSLVPLYQSECSPKWIRGTIIAAYQLAITIGLLLAAIVNNATHDRNDSGSYRIPVAVQLLYGLILGFGIFFFPETPRFFVKTGNTAEASKSLGRLRSLPSDHPAIAEELAEIIANHEYDLALGTSSWLDLLKSHGRQRRRLLTGCGIMVAQQLTGINFIFYYGTQFFKNSGISNPFLIGLTTNLVNVASTIPGLLLVERWGRRQLLFWGAAGMTICEFIVAIIGATSSSNVANTVLIAFTCIYIFFFAISWGVAGWVVVGENFSLQFRAQSIACSIASNWLFNWAIGFATPYLVDEAPGAAGLQTKVFFIWGACCLGCAVFVYLCIFETKGLTLEQVDDMYEKVSQAWQSESYTPQDTFQEQIRKQSTCGVEHVEGQDARGVVEVHSDIKSQTVQV